MPADAVHTSPSVALFMRAGTGVWKGQFYFLQKDLSLWGSQICLELRSHTLNCVHMLLYCGARLSTKITGLTSLFFILSCRMVWREASISHVCITLTMLLLVALGLVFPVLVVATEMAENSNHKSTSPLFNYSGISLPPEHIPYFLHNNKRVVKQCRLDPLCPFQVRNRLFF